MTNTKRRNMSISDADYAELKAIGNGNASQGIRKLLSTPRMDDDGLMAIAAFRYSLGRRTYIVSECARWIKREWPRLHKRDRMIIPREIQEAAERDALGDECDKAEWLAILELAEADGREAV